jgi:hypothetical protein
MKVAYLLIACAMTVVAAAQVSSPTAPASGYTFKNYRIGMSLEEFRNASDKKQATAIQSDAANKYKAKKITVMLPVCTDQYTGVINILDSDSMALPGEIVCETAIHGENKESETVAGVEPVEIVYHFWQNNLYRISFRFKSEYFPVILSAFSEKYGAPASKRTEPFQNGFGAQWTGSIVVWSGVANQTIVLREGSHNGPGQGDDPLGFQGSTVTIMDLAIMKEILKTAPKQKSDF